MSELRLSLVYEASKIEGPTEGPSILLGDVLVSFTP